MAPFNPEAPVLDTYQAVVQAYSDFLTVAIHTILYERNIYPQSSFLKARKYNYPVRQSRHPKVCKWIQDAVAAVEAEMLKSSISSTSLMIHAPPPSSKPLERYVFSTASFPRIPPSEILTPFTNLPSGPLPTNIDASSNVKSSTNTSSKIQTQIPPTSNLPEQFRATLSRLTTSQSRLEPLRHENCSFTLAIELRDDDASSSEAGGVEPPIGRDEDKRWIVAEPGWQREKRADTNNAAEQAKDAQQTGKPNDENPTHDNAGNDPHAISSSTHDRDGLGPDRGRYVGGARTTPVRSVEAGAFQMEVWVEEGAAKFGVRLEDDNEDREGEGA